MNVTDQRIVELAQPGDLMITADILLAAEVAVKDGQALAASCARKPTSMTLILVA